MVKKRVRKNRIRPKVKCHCNRRHCIKGDVDIRTRKKHWIQDEHKRAKMVKNKK
jgi:hypothetical protein